MILYLVGNNSQKKSIGCAENAAEMMQTVCRIPRASLSISKWCIINNLDNWR